MHGGSQRTVTSWSGSLDRWVQAGAHHGRKPFATSGAAFPLPSLRGPPAGEDDAPLLIWSRGACAEPLGPVCLFRPRPTSVPWVVGPPRGTFTARPVILLRPVRALAHPTSPKKETRTDSTTETEQAERNRGPRGRSPGRRRGGDPAGLRVNPCSPVSQLRPQRAQPCTR